jgi:hypothetical protein
VCKVNGVVVDEKEITLTGGSVELIVFITTFDEAGNMTIEINGLTGSLVVRELEEEPSLEPEPGTVAEIPTQGILEEHISGSRWFVIWVLIGVCLVFSVRSAINFYIRRFRRDKRVNNN